MSAERDRVETASPALPEDEAKEPYEMSKSQVASASPGIVMCTFVAKIKSSNEPDTLETSSDSTVIFGYDQ